MSCQQHSAKILFRLCTLASTAMALSTFLCTQRTLAQVTVGQFSPQPDVVQSVSGDCTAYNNALSTNGVSVNGQSYPGRCRFISFTPLFDGMELGSDMEAFLHSPAHPPLFQVQTFGWPGVFGLPGQYCAISSGLSVTLSASVQTTRLQWVWTGASTVGQMCAAQVTNVNGASSSPPDLGTRVSSLVQGGANELAQKSQPIVQCGPTLAAANLALDQQIWSLLQGVVRYEVRVFHTFVDPVIQTGACEAKCNNCFKGWVGNITCTAKADGLSMDQDKSQYKWGETQTWDVGGTATTTGATTIYPAKFSALGSGSKYDPITKNEVDWSINGTKMGTLTDYGVNAPTRFSTSNDSVTNALKTTQDGTSSRSDISETQLKFNADQSDHNKVSSTAPLPGSCLNAQALAGAPCSVSCTWNLLNQQ